MRAKVHIINSLTIWTLFGQTSLYEPFVNYFSSWTGGDYLAAIFSLGLNLQALFFGSVAPDKLDDFIYDKEGTDLWLQQRRKWTHAWSICIPLLVASALFLGVDNFITIFLAAYSLHCVVDVFTLVGVPIVDPASRVSFLPLLEDTYQERRFEIVSRLAFGLALYVNYGGSLPFF